MSRIGKLPVPLPKGVSATWEEPLVKVKGPKGELTVEVKKPCTVEIADSEINIKRPDDTRISKSYQGLFRSLTMNAVTGVHEGFEKKLEVVGVGYRAEVDGKVLKIFVGYASFKEFHIPDGIDVKVEGQIITVSGIDRQVVGDSAARIRSWRPPEPYKGKGIRYVGEQVKRKAGKAAVGGKG